MEELKEVTVPYVVHEGEMTRMVEDLRELMQDAPDERTKQEFEKLIRKLENM